MKRIESRTKRIVVLSLFLAFGIVLYVFETLFFPPLPIPGAKVGLTSIVTLLLLCLYSWRECLLNVLFRTIVGSIITGTFLTASFLYSFFGALISALVMIAFCLCFKNKFSLVGISLLGATTHNLTQLFLGVILIGHPGILFQMPFLISAAILTGFFNGFVANLTVGFREIRID